MYSIIKFPLAQLNHFKIVEYFFCEENDINPKNSHFSRILILFLVIFVILSCNNPSKTGVLITPTIKESSNTTTPILPTEKPLATASVGWVDSRAKFLYSDCPGADLPKPTSYVEMGSLTCNYSIEGGSQGMSIRQVNDFEDLQDQFNSSKDYAQQQIASFMSKPNAQLTLLSNELDANLYMITFDGDNPTNSPQVPLCVFAGGNQIVNKKFITGFQFYACSLEKSAEDYQAAFQTMVESARTAIHRAESE